MSQAHPLLAAGASCVQQALDSGALPEIRSILEAHAALPTQVKEQHVALSGTAGAGKTHTTQCLVRSLSDTSMVDNTLTGAEQPLVPLRISWWVAGHRRCLLCPMWLHDMKPTVL
jgi:hypothetical protein